jgi:pimeloyl-ACP methyl ester carboxylesterase
MRRHTLFAAVTTVTCAAVLAACGGAEDVASKSSGSTAVTSRAQPSSSPGTSADPPSASGSSKSQQRPAGFGPGPPGQGLGRFYHQHVDWTDCGGGDSCADIWVPLNYDAPDGLAITLKAKRQPAADPSHKVGSLFINPGGPGGSGIDYLGYANFDKAITDVYDVIGFDPRGVGRSTPVDCLSDSGMDAYLASDPSPDTPAEVSQMQQQWARFTAGCVARSGPLLQHMSTVEVARDLDILRSLVGDRSLHYFGASYGTYIGATYAALFPKRVGRMVLDGAVDPLASPHKSEISQAAGFETALTAYLQDCVASSDCPLGTSVDTARANLAALLKQIDSKPLPTSSGRPLTEGLAFLGVIVTLYSRSTWKYLTQGLTQAVSGQGDVLLALSDAYDDRQPDGTYSSNLLEAEPAVNCLDHPEHESVAEIESGAAEFERVAPVFGSVAAWFPYECSNWPVPRIQPLPDFSAKGAAPIVVVGTTRDPATPYQQAVNLAHELSSGVLLSRDGDGHTAYASGNTCIDSAVDAYLAQGTVPALGTTC